MFSVKRASVIALITTALWLFGAPTLADPDPVSGYSEGWDVDGDLAGWDPNTIKTEIEQVNSGGNPGGYLSTSGDVGGTFDVGALFRGPELTGDYRGATWTLSVDLSFMSADFDPENGDSVHFDSENGESGEFDASWLRFRQGPLSPLNGWSHPLADTFVSDWMTYSVTFDPTWTDAEARANDWLPDNESISPGSNASPPFADTMASVLWAEVRISGEGFLLAGIDNVVLGAAGSATVEVELAEGVNEVDVGFMQYVVNVVEAGTDTFQTCVAVVPDHLNGTWFKLNRLEGTGNCDFELSKWTWVNRKWEFFRDERDDLLKVRIIKSDTTAVFDGAYIQVEFFDFLSPQPLCLTDQNPPGPIEDEPLTILADPATIFGKFSFQQATGECNRPRSLGWGRSEWLTPVGLAGNPVHHVHGQITFMIVELSRARIERTVRKDIRRQLIRARRNIRRHHFLNAIANFEQIARIAQAASAEDFSRSPVTNLRGLFIARGITAAFSTSEQILRMPYTIPGDIRP